MIFSDEFERIVCPLGERNNEAEFRAVCLERYFQLVFLGLLLDSQVHCEELGALVPRPLLR